MQRRHTHIATGIVAIAGAVAAWLLSTQVFPYYSLNHDEGVYLLQAEMLLNGQLHLTPPVEDALRPWFFVADGDQLYPKYAPVPATMFALGKLFGGYRLALVGIATANLVLVITVVREVFDRLTGLLAGVFVLVSPLFLIESAVFLPYAPTGLLNLLFAYGYLRADRTGSHRWAAVAGTAAGVAFFSRPYTAVLFATPFIVHALWTLTRQRNWREALERDTGWRGTLTRQATIAVLGLCGVGVALVYNAVMTGSPFVFPYQAFAPLDGLGFGHRKILNHEITYTPSLALRANREVVELFFTEWITGGTLGAVLAGIGVGHTIRRRVPPREGVLAGLFVTIIAGNVYFWGNYNVLGDIDRAGDGLIATLGPYYHFDLLLPTAAFAAAGTLWLGRLMHRTLNSRLDLDQRLVRVTMSLVLLLSVSAVGSVTAGNIDERIEKNMVATNAYEDAYEPFEDGPPENSLILLPTPYGDWLNHPFQRLRNDPKFDGRAVYALDNQPFEVVDAFPNRSVYRYGYRGGWAPYVGSPDAARLQRVRDISGDRVRLETTVGVPDQAVSVTTRIAANDRNVYYVASNTTDGLDLNLTLSHGQVRVDGDVRPVENETSTVDTEELVVFDTNESETETETVRVTVFVDYGGGQGFSYRFDLPVTVADGQVRALTPHVEYCQNGRNCNGAAVYIPSSTPDSIFVKTKLTAEASARNTTKPAAKNRQ